MMKHVARVAFVVLTAAACQPFDKADELKAGESLVAASETRFFGLFGLSNEEIRIDLARDTDGMVLDELEGEVLGALLLPPDDYCMLRDVVADDASLLNSTEGDRLCEPGFVRGRCQWPCRGALWRVSAR